MYNMFYLILLINYLFEILFLYSNILIFLFYNAEPTQKLHIINIMFYLNLLDFLILIYRHNYLMMILLFPYKLFEEDKVHKENIFLFQIFQFFFEFLPYSCLLLLENVFSGLFCQLFPFFNI